MAVRTRPADRECAGRAEGSARADPSADNRLESESSHGASIDAGNPVVFARATDLGLQGTELPLEIERATDAVAVLEELRGVVAEWLGLVTDRREATRRSPGLPKVGFVAPPLTYVTTGGSTVDASEADLSGRLMSMQTAHRSYMVTGAIATAAAACVPGTVVHEAARPSAARRQPATIRIAHPYGLMDAVSSAESAGPAAPEPFIRGVTVGRTARHILDGQVWIGRSLMEAARPRQ
jgi:2-methylaconitate cis-trans-isomerase PrpF